jgi:small-conductance mechanosensitive channel
MVPASEQPQAVTAIPDDITPLEVRELVSRLSDEEVRKLIIAQLDKQAVAPPEQADAEAYIGQLRVGVQVARESLGNVLTSGDKIYALPAAVWRHLTEAGHVSGGYLLFQLIGLLLAGWGGARLARRVFERSAAKARAAGSPKKRLDLVCYGLVTGSLRLGTFALCALVFVTITSQQMPAAQAFWSELVWCMVLIGMVLLLVRQLRDLSSKDSGSSHAPDNSLRQVLVWSMLLSGSMVLPDPLINIAIDSGADDDTVLLLNLIAGALFVGMIIVLVIRLRGYGAALILGEDAESSSLRQGLAKSWWVLAIVYLLMIWFLAIGRRAATGESSLVPGIGSLMLVALIPYMDQWLRSLITWYFADKPASDADGSAAEPGADIVAASDVSANAPSYVATALRYTRAIMVLFILMIFMQLWDIDIRALSAQLVGPRFASATFDIGITVFVTWALWGMIRISIERKLDEGKPAAGEEGESEAGGLGGSRVETVLPLIRVSIKITLIVMAVLISLSALGVNIGPLIAGAGVVGIAIGFGAQTLVRDIVSGFFYLLDDAFRIGEYVVIDQIRGTVEKISVRSFQLRHHEGPVHTVPYGEIRTLTNWSRDWSILKFELRVPFETDIDMVRKMIKQIGLNMMEDPTFGPLMLAPLKSQGVNRIDDSALIIRCKFTSIPGQQYLIRREAFTRIQRAFEEKGIQFAPRRVLVEATTPEEAVKAAASALDQEVPKEPPRNTM